MKVGMYVLAVCALWVSAAGCVVASTNTCGRCNRHLVTINDRIYEVDMKKQCARRVYIDDSCEDGAEITIIEETIVEVDD